MATASERGQDDWSEGLSKLAEATRHNMTASNLAIAGAVAIGAAAFTYFWDATRRNDFLEGARRMAEGSMSLWTDSASASPSVNQ